jgi:peptide/nickel transport system substrate-binding protein
MREDIMVRAFARGLSVIAAAAVLAFAMPAVAQKTVTVAVGIDPTSIDPHKISGGGDYQFFNHVFEGLYGHDNQGRLAPELAESHEVSADGRVNTFKLRPGVKFHNGEAFTAEDVRFSWQRSNDPETRNPRAAIVTRNIEDVEVVDALTVRLKLKDPDASLLENLGEYFYIVNKATLEKMGNDAFGREPIGTGPYRFVSRSIKENMVLAAFPEHWGKVPKIDRLVMRVVADPQTRIAMIRAGEVDAIVNVPPQVGKQLESDPNLNLVVSPSFQNIFILLNTRAAHGQFADPRVRRALNHAVDKATLIRRVMFGYATVSAAPCHIDITGCDIGREPYSYDPKMARALLEEANFDFSRTYTFWGQTPGRAAQSKEVAEAVAFYLNQVGVKTRMEFLEYGAWLSRITAREYDKYDIHWQNWTDYNNDPMGRLPRAMRTGGSLSWHSDPVLDEMLDKANGITDPNERLAHLQKTFTHIYDNPPYIFLWTTNEIYATRKNIRWTPRANVSWPVFWEVEKD